MSRRALLRLAALGAGALVAGPNLAGCDSDEATPTAGTPESQPSPGGAAENDNQQRSGEFTAKPTKSWNFNSLDELRVATPEEPIYNNEAQIYTDDEANVRTEGKKLILEAHKQRTAGKEYTSGKVDTQETFSFEYGRLEARMKLPKGKGTWPAFWLLSANQVHTAELNPTESDWEKERFYMRDGEVDIMEAYGNKPGQVEATVHTFDKSIEKQITVEDASENYHTYGIDITPNSISWTIDGKVYQTIKKPKKPTSDNWPIGNGNEFYWILNLAMGGDAAGEIDNKQSEHWQLLVDQVNFYEYTGK
jgi:beta-glucanase (GH16 family)